MYHKLIKLSIIFIITALLFCVPAAKAAIVIVDNGFSVSIPDYSLTADDIVDFTPTESGSAHAYKAHYRVNITPRIYARSTGYLNGRIMFNGTFALSDPNNNQTVFESIQIEGNTVISDNVFSTVVWGSGANNATFTYFSAFNNYNVQTSGELVPSPSFYVDFWIFTDGRQEDNIQLSCSSGDMADNVVFSSSPSSEGLADIIAAGVVDSLGTYNESGTVINYLDQILLQTDRIIYNQEDNESLLSSIISILNSTYSAVDGVETLLSTINNSINNIDNLIDTISWKYFNNVEISSSTSLNGTYDTSTKTTSSNNSIFVKYKVYTSINIPFITRICFGVGIGNYAAYANKDHYIYIDKVYRYNGSSYSEVIYPESFYSEQSYRQYPYFYFYDNSYITERSTWYYVFELKCKASSTTLTFNNDYASTNYIDSNDIEYWQLRQIFYQYQMIHQGEENTEAQQELANAASQMDQAAQAMNVVKPDSGQVIPQSLVSNEVAAAQGTMFSWLNNSYILMILLACFTIALIGFVIYGKSG